MNKMQKIGIGYDIHKLVKGRPLILGGIEIPFEKGLLGHSDGDALLHAISDAMLGACGLGDIGQYFPDTDPKFKNADSSKLLSEVFLKIREKGFKVVNMDSNIIVQRPKMSSHVLNMRKKIAEILNMDIDNVSIKARSNEGLDAVGNEEAIAVQAVVLLAAQNK